MKLPGKAIIQFHSQEDIELLKAFAIGNGLDTWMRKLSSRTYHHQLCCRLAGRLFASYGHTYVYEASEWASYRAEINADLFLCTVQEYLEYIGWIEAEDEQMPVCLEELL